MATDGSCFRNASAHLLIFASWRLICSQCFSPFADFCLLTAHLFGMLQPICLLLVIFFDWENDTPKSHEKHAFEPNRLKYKPFRVKPTARILHSVSVSLVAENPLFEEDLKKTPKSHGKTCFWAKPVEIQTLRGKTDPEDPEFGLRFTPRWKSTVRKEKKRDTPTSNEKHAFEPNRLKYKPFGVKPTDTLFGWFPVGEKQGWWDFPCHW